MTCRRCANTGDGAVGPILAGIALPAGKELGRVACRWAASLTTSPAPPTWRTTWRAPACACSRPSACPALRRTPRPTPSWWPSSPPPSRPPPPVRRPSSRAEGRRGTGGGGGGETGGVACVGPPRPPPPGAALAVARALAALQWLRAQGAQQIY